MASYHWPSYYLSRFNFVVVHVFTVGYWFPFLLNNPFNFSYVVTTLDAPAGDIKPAGQCAPVIWDNVYYDIGLWLVWYAASFACQP